MATRNSSRRRAGLHTLPAQVAPVSAEMARMAEFFKALSDATRLSVITAILDRELCVQEISELIGMSQSAVSHQLRLLRNAGLAKRRRQGRNIYYSLDDRHVESLIKAAFEHSTHTPGGRLRE
ncbi:MAG: winged helix-turn-helix transcriptional regulator [Nitrospinae bacterium]|nr:winged helix-turn-helix transcriptional regulator [Nitrospinota bacterium]